jgi:hypothetical protein
MPEIVMRHKNKTVLPYVLSVPDGADVDTYVAGWMSMSDGWSVDKKTDPAEVPAPATTPAEPADSKEK